MKEFLKIYIGLAVIFIGGFVALGILAQSNWINPPEATSWPINQVWIDTDNPSFYDYSYDNIYTYATSSWTFDYEVVYEYSDLSGSGTPSSGASHGSSSDYVASSSISSSYFTKDVWFATKFCFNPVGTTGCSATTTPVWDLKSLGFFDYDSGTFTDESGLPISFSDFGGVASIKITDFRFIDSGDTAQLQFTYNIGDAVSDTPIIFTASVKTQSATSWTDVASTSDTISLYPLSGMPSYILTFSSSTLTYGVVNNIRVAGSHPVIAIIPDYYSFTYVTGFIEESIDLLGTPLNSLVQGIKNTLNAYYELLMSKFPFSWVAGLVNAVNQAQHISQSIEYPSLSIDVPTGDSATTSVNVVPIEGMLSGSSTEGHPLSQNVTDLRTLMKLALYGGYIWWLSHEAIILSQTL